jgi:hypothetical protein
VKKYKKTVSTSLPESAMNNFTEFSMVEPMDMAHFFGFTKKEVQLLAKEHGMDFDELEKWYDGYQIGDELSIFNPNSVMMALWDKRCSNTWWGTSSIHQFDDCIRNNFDGICDELTFLINGNHYSIDPIHLDQYVWGEVNSKDDILTAMIHFGYLTYDRTSGECYVPNNEILGGLSTHVSSLAKNSSWEPARTLFACKSRISIRNRRHISAI